MWRDNEARGSEETACLLPFGRKKQWRLGVHNHAKNAHLPSHFQYQPNEAVSHNHVNYVLRDIVNKNELIWLAPT